MNFLITLWWAFNFNFIDHNRISVPICVEKINKWNKQPQQKRALMNIKGVSSWEIDCQGNAIEA